ncbi:MAG: C4-dicarboxylate ABC transporter permease [Rhodobacterales bacterium 32-67-9]|nr:MAG: C4-dicarboxylate ABC transporter permease [Rhodobacterales bacterium 32-67-9]
MLMRVSAVWAKAEMMLATALAVLVTGLVLLNVVTRNIGAALFWVDELAIYAMVWMAFMGASAALHYGNSVAITLISDAVARPVAQVIRLFVHIVLTLFSFSMIYFCWRWFQPLDMLRAGFDIEAFQATTFNFVYSEPTTTLGVPKYVFWIVVWLFALGASLHSTAHLLSWRAGGMSK